MKQKIPQKLFEEIKNSIPLSCVDLIVINRNNEFLLVKRSITPYKNKWCLPGGIIKRNQKIHEKLYEIAKKELGINVEIIRPIGFYEKVYSSRHDISHCFIVKSNNLKNLKLDFQAEEMKFFKKIPKNAALFHIEMLQDAGFKKSTK